MNLYKKRKFFSKKLLIIVVLIIIGLIIAGKNNVINNTKSSNIMHLLASNNNDNYNYMIESTQLKYHTLAEAVEAASNGDTISLLQDTVDISDVTITKELTLDTKNNILRRGNVVENSDGTLSEFLSESKSIIIRDGGTFNICGYGIIWGGGELLSDPTINVLNNGTLNIYKVVLNCPNGIAISCNSDNPENKAIANIEDTDIFGYRDIISGENSIINVKSGNLDIAPFTVVPGSPCSVVIQGGIVNIGDSTKDLSKATPAIKNGIQCSENDVWNYNNGRIYPYSVSIGQTEQYYSYAPKTIRENCKIEEAVDLQANKMIYLVDETSDSINNYKIEGSNDTYSTLGAAVAKANNNDVITLLRDCNDDLDVGIQRKTLTLNINGKKLSRIFSDIGIRYGGNLTVQGGGEITQDNYGSIVVYDSGNLNVDDVDINCYRKYDVINPNYDGHLAPKAIVCVTEGESQAFVNIMNSTISEIYSEGELSNVNIVSGKVERGIHNTKGKVNIGSKTSEFSIVSPEVYGISNIDGGTWNFYNGILKGINGTYDIEPTEIREGYHIYNTDGLDTTDVTYLVSDDTQVEANYEIESTGEKYESLRKAVTAANNNDTIKLLKDVTDISHCFINKKLTLDLQNYTIKRGIGTNENGIDFQYSKAIVLADGGDFTVAGTGKIISGGYNKEAEVISVLDGGTFTLNGGILIASNNNTIYCHSLDEDSKAIVNIESGEVNGECSIFADKDSIVNINGGKLGKAPITYDGDIWTGVNIKGGTVNVGDKNKEVSTENPVIERGIVIVENGEWNFYNGIIHPYTTLIPPSETIIYNQEPTKIREGYKIEKTKDEQGKDESAFLVAAEDQFEIIEEYEIQENKIMNIQPNTKLESFKTKIRSNKEYQVFEGESTITNTDIIKTGHVLKVGNIEYILVVNGDANGDGKTDIRDILAINKHRLDKVKLTGVFLQAGDVTKDGKVDLRDILIINRFRLKKIDKI